MKQIKNVFLILLALTSCTKKKEDPTPPITRAQILSAKKWQLRSSTIEAPGQPLTDIYAQLGACSRDDYEQFNSPNTFIYDEGLTKCSPADPQTQVGVWALTNDETQLTITAAGSSMTSKIDELTETLLKTTTIETQGNGVNAIIKSTYVVIN